MAKAICIQDINPVALKLKTLIMNLIIMALCALSAIAIACTGFVKLEVSIVADESMMSSMGIDTTQINIADIPEKERSIQLALEVEPKSVLSAISGESRKVVDTALEAQIDSLLQQAHPVIKSLTKMLVRVSYQQLYDEFTAEMFGSEAEIKKQLADQGIDADAILKKANKLIDDLFSEDPDLNQIKTDLKGELVKLTKEGENSELLDTFDQVFDEIVALCTDENGNFDPVNAFLTLLMKEIDPNASGTTAALMADEVSSDVQAQLKTFLNDQIDEPTKDTIALVLRICGYVLLALLLVWAMTFLHVLLKTLLSRNKGVSVWFPCLLSILLFIVLVIVPNAAWIIAGKVAAESIAMVSSLKVISVSAIICGICAFALMIFSFFYKRTRRENKAYADAKKNGEI